MTETLNKLIDRITERLCSMNCDAESSCLCSAHQFRSSLAGIARPSPQEREKFIACMADGLLTDIAERHRNHPCALDDCGLCTDRIEEVLNAVYKKAAALAAPPEKCDCGRPLTMCSSCAVEEYQAAHTDCVTCCPPLAPSSSGETEP